MSDSNAFDRQLAREIDNLAGPEPRVDVREIVEGATSTRQRASFGGWLGSVPAAALVGAIVVALVLGVGFLWFDRSAVVTPAATPTAEPSPSASFGETSLSVLAETSVAGTWALPQPLACRSQMPAMNDPWVTSIEVCDGLRFEVPDDPRLTGSGHFLQETWLERTAPERWQLFNDGGSWESQRYQDHDRFVFRGDGGYSGLTAVLTLADDGTLSGFVRTGAPRRNDE